jgi:hypothetical protein
MKITTILLTLAVYPAVLCTPLLGQKLKAKIYREGVLVHQKGDTVFFYQSVPKSKDGALPRSNYVHPLYNVDGSVITEDFPVDHLHHRGVFWAWHQVYVGNERMGDAWEIKDFTWDVANVKTKKNKDKSLSVFSTVWWKSPRYMEGNWMKPFVEEAVEIHVHRQEKNHRVIDFTIALKALVDSVRIGGSEDAKGYSGFSVRMRLPEDVRFISGGQPVQPQTLQLSAGSWMQIEGGIGALDSTAGVVMIDHPENPQYPQPWIIRKARSMQNAAFPGNTLFPLSTTEPLRLHYRLVVYADAIEPEVLNGLVNSFQAQLLQHQTP